MKQTLETRIAFILTIAGSFGFVITKLVDVKNASFAISGIALLLSLIASLVISLFLFSRLTVKRTKIFAVIAAILLIGSVLSFYLFQKHFINSTVIVPEFQGDSITRQKYFKGADYTTNAQKIVNLKPELKRDDNALMAMFQNKFDDVWIPNSVRDTELNLAMWYILFVIVVVSAISLTTEIITKKGNATKRKIPVSEPA
jgi:hypothetical protein